MIDSDIREVLARRISLHPEDSFALEECWREEIKILSNNVNQTIDFLLNRCTGDEYAWLSEVFEEVQEKLKSDSFTKCLYSVAKKYPKQTQENNILGFIIPLDKK